MTEAAPAAGPGETDQRRRFARLEARELSGHAGSRLVIDRLSCSFLLDTVTVVAGEPGSGKTSLLDLLSGRLRASGGSVRLIGRGVTRLSASARARRGIGRGYAEPQCFPELPVIENVRLAVQSRRREGLDAWTVWRSHRNTIERAYALVDRVSLSDAADEPAGRLSPLNRRRLEFAMLMALEPVAYLLDDPGAGLPESELPVVRELLGMLAAQRHKIIVLAERRPELIAGLADRVVVLRDGRVASDGPAGEIEASRIAGEAFERLAAS